MKPLRGTDQIADSRLDFLAGGGEMGALTRAYDWSSTAPRASGNVAAEPADHRETGA